MIWKAIKGLFGKKTEVTPLAETPPNVVGFAALNKIAMLNGLPEAPTPSHWSDAAAVSYHMATAKEYMEPEGVLSYAQRTGDWSAAADEEHRIYAIRSRMISRGKTIKKLKNQKKKFSHLLAEQEADKAAINEGRF